MSTEVASAEGSLRCQTNSRQPTRHGICGARIPRLSPHPCSDAKPSRTAQSAPPRAHRPFLAASLLVGVLQNPIRTLFSAQLLRPLSRRLDSPARGERLYERLTRQNTISVGSQSNLSWQACSISPVTRPSCHSSPKIKMGRYLNRPAKGIGIHDIDPNDRVHRSKQFQIQRPDTR